MLEKLITKEIKETQLGKKLFKMLSDIFKHKENIENVILLFESDKNRQKMINFLKKRKRSVDEIHYYISKLN